MSLTPATFFYYGSTSLFNSRVVNNIYNIYLLLKVMNEDFDAIILSAENNNGVFNSIKSDYSTLNTNNATLNTDLGSYYSSVGTTSSTLTAFQSIATTLATINSNVSAIASTWNSFYNSDLSSNDNGAIINLSHKDMSVLFRGTLSFVNTLNEIATLNINLSSELQPAFSSTILNSQITIIGDINTNSQAMKYYAVTAANDIDTLRTSWASYGQAAGIIVHNNVLLSSQITSVANDLTSVSTATTDDLICQTNLFENYYGAAGSDVTTTYPSV